MNLTPQNRASQVLSQKLCSQKQSLSSNLQLVNRNLDELHDKYLEELISSEADSIMQLQSETKSTKARKTVCKITNKKLSASSRVKNETKGDQKLRIIIFNHYYDLIYQSLRRQILS